MAVKTKRETEESKKNRRKMRLHSIRWSNIAKMLDFYSQFNPSPLSIKQFIDFGK